MANARIQARKSLAIFGAVVVAEIGWRRYMLLRLIDTGVPRPVPVGGVIWALWHVPLILSGQYAFSAYPLLSAGLFLVSVVSFSYLLAWSRLQSGSVWPAIIAHASWNAVIQSAFGASTSGGAIWIGESGVLVAAVIVVTTALIVRGRWVIRRTPDDTRNADLATVLQI